MQDGLAFERQLNELQAKIAELRKLNTGSHLELTGEIALLEERLRKQTAEVYAQLSPWERVNVARHADRPLTSDYVQLMLDDFVEIHGDRVFGDDRAILTGLATMGGQRFLLVGHRKGKTVKDRLACNFGCAHPEGYRKAMQKMRMAEKWKLPIVTFINTPGAYPGIGAEERGQASAIARNILEMFDLKVPIVCIVIGEGGSGGAIALATANAVLMLEHAIYSVISPEGCASILWRSGENAKDAAEALKLTAQDLHRLGVIDQVVAEPLGGAHRNPALTLQNLSQALDGALRDQAGLDGGVLRARRRDKFLEMGRAGLA
ncbi:MAG TPA: acetyl-CoA carboxylase carboxyltransferase subunit alpha [Magnetospirillum sp.]|nr:acetyl-CoA carboxylase carboxyltransferase subunit alpha [Magnetospirillum sp.]